MLIQDHEGINHILDLETKGRTYCGEDVSVFPQVEPEEINYENGEECSTCYKKYKADRFGKE